MLKEIDARKLRKGMFLNKLCGSWIKHPFWKSSFLIEEQNDINKILKSGISRVVIDTSKGLDVEGSKPKNPEPATEEKKAHIKEVKPQKVGMKAEWEKAKKVCEQAKEAVAIMFKDIRMGNTFAITDVQPIVEDIAKSVIRNPEALINVARLKTQDDYTYLHSVAVCAMMTALGHRLNLSEAEIKNAALGGLLHDVGKALMPLNVLNKPGKLTDKEFALMKTHTVEGYKLLKDDEELNSHVLDIALHHHEKFDGSGYPDRLAGEDISLLARMGAVCDVYDAVTSTRPYKESWPPALAIKRMVSWKGHFDPRVLQAFIKTLGIYPTGSLVRLESGKLGVVTEQAEASLLEPTVKVFFSIKSKSPIPISELVLSSKQCEDHIVGLETPDKWGFKNLDEMWMPN